MPKLQGVERTAVPNATNDTQQRGQQQNTFDERSAADGKRSVASDERSPALPDVAELTPNALMRRTVDESPAEAAPFTVGDRADDRLLLLPEISRRTRLSEATHRWMRHQGEGPPLFRLGRRLVGWESEVLAWIESQAAQGRT